MNKIIKSFEIGIYCTFGVGCCIMAIMNPYDNLTTLSKICALFISFIMFASSARCFKEYLKD